jgi:hypothetical protein
MTTGAVIVAWGKPLFLGDEDVSAALAFEIGERRARFASLEPNEQGQMASAGGAQARGGAEGGNVRTNTAGSKTLQPARPEPGRPPGWLAGFRLDAGRRRRPSARLS